MGKKLAIKGHPTRGKEVIELLEMMGGKNFTLDGTNDWYVINDLDNSITFRDHNYINCHEFVKFTLEEFLEKYPFKVGDKVNVLFKSYIDENEYCESTITEVKSMRWNETLGKLAYKVKYCSSEFYAEQLKPYKEMNMENKEEKLFDSIIWHLRNSVNNGKQNLSGGECEAYFREVVKKNNENKMKSVLAELLEHIKTTPKEDLEREFEEIKEWSNVGPTIEEFKAFCECVNKKPKYPTTYEECCKVLFGNESYSEFTFIPAKVCNSYYRGDFITELPFEIIPYEREIRMLYKLLVCRDAYWKIAGEEMGLGKPWEPDLENEELYCVQNYNKQIIKSKTNTAFNKILIFPTEEMRDAFYENFKDLIEKCKELL